MNKKKSIVKSFLMYMIQLKMEIIIGFLLHYFLMAFFLILSFPFFTIMEEARASNKHLGTSIYVRYCSDN